MSRRRRHYSRVRAQSLVAHLHLDGKLVGGGAVENISAGGLLVRTGQQLPSGAALQLDLVRPGMKKPFRLPGFVVEHSGGQGGVRPAMRIRFDLSADSSASRLHVLLGELGLRELMEPGPPQPPPVPLPPLATGAPRAWAPVAGSPPVLLPQPPPARTVPPPQAPVQVEAQLQALREELRWTRAQLERHEAELAALRTELRARRP
jgi:hypothetical protein